MFAPRVAASLRTAGRIQTAAVAKNAFVRARVMAPVGTRILSTSQSNQKELTVAPLVEQRKNRPTSPHLTIYQPQLTWYMSMFHRATGGALAVGLYGGAIAYAVGPLVGLGFDAATITSAIATLPVAAKVAGKFIVAYPFTYHAFNGVRHLIWDTASKLTLKGVYSTGYTVLGLSTVSALALAFI
ncbi:cytochrome b subunit of succinate dehydrogenase, Sdh3p [Entomortierella chlamydospora]|uniref:Cytochrome b subunit of succinate dehydrogenase, Sdh3p n=1 Tax=Entomortierella chlamydospora TaxID=101097 RepID=A0A9P6N3C9_9FUNG|nr:cytochrome b subunit of succinate dehydrogenase, Sdh3p [Entomortierella chlamydospora]KAG0022219.1 cytochrome b subunit of succinate dehydrogenase, Sdh3p [Entomortierella chlamydospora]